MLYHYIFYNPGIYLGQAAGNRLYTANHVLPYRPPSKFWRFIQSRDTIDIGVEVWGHEVFNSQKTFIYRLITSSFVIIYDALKQPSAAERECFIQKNFGQWQIDLKPRQSQDWNVLHNWEKIQNIPFCDRVSVRERW